MAYEDYSYDNLLVEMLDTVNEDQTVDTREGSVIYDAIAPAALELQNLFMEMSAMLNDTFASTASREYLILRCAERGIEPEEATYAILKGEFTPGGLDLTGQRFNLNDLNYVVLDLISETDEISYYQVQCETAGVEGNSYFGTMLPIEYVDGLETAELTELLIPGEDEEDTEVLRQRYFDSFGYRAFGGNLQDYLEKVNAIDGVGGVKVVPVWNGGGTVLLVIIDSTYGAASDTLVQLVKDTMDPEPYGTGTGLAPIGHVVTVQSAEEVSIKIAATMSFDSSYSFDTLEETIEETIEEYLLSLRQSWASSTTLTVRISQIETKLLAITGIEDIEDTTINGSTSNLELGEYEIPVFGSVTNNG